MSTRVRLITSRRNVSRVPRASASARVFSPARRAATHLLQPALLLLANDECGELLIRDGFPCTRLELPDLHAPRHLSIPLLRGIRHFLLHKKTWVLCLPSPATDSLPLSSRALREWIASCVASWRAVGVAWYNTDVVCAAFPAAGLPLASARNAWRMECLERSQRFIPADPRSPKWSYRSLIGLVFLYCLLFVEQARACSLAPRHHPLLPACLCQPAAAYRLRPSAS